MLDSPGNPTGAVFSPAALAEVAKLAVERDLWIVSDECYEALTYEGRHVSIASLSARGQGAHDRRQHLLEGVRHDGLAHRLRGRGPSP